MSAYWKRFEDEKPARAGDYCYFTDEKMHTIHFGYFDVVPPLAPNNRPVFVRINGKGFRNNIVEVDQVVFWCKPNQINSTWGTAN